MRRFVVVVLAAVDLSLGAMVGHGLWCAAADDERVGTRPWPDDAGPPPAIDGREPGAADDPTAELSLDAAVGPPDERPAHEAASAAIAAQAHEVGCVAGAPDCPRSAWPRTSVVVSAFALQIDEVAAADYQACVDAGACTPRVCEEPDAPDARVADCVAWDQARSFCRWRGGRLPSEVEWEVAARAYGGGRYPWGEAPLECAGATPLDLTRSGLVAMGGGRAEWTGDFHSAAPPDGEDPGGPAWGSFRAVRGGAGCAPGLAAALLARRAVHGSRRSPTIGFRCAWSRAVPRRTADTSAISASLRDAEQP